MRSHAGGRRWGQPLIIVVIALLAVVTIGSAWQIGDRIQRAPAGVPAPSHAPTPTPPLMRHDTPGDRP